MVTYDTDTTAAPSGWEPGRFDVTQPGQTSGRDAMRRWTQATRRNVYLDNDDFAHTVRFHLGDDYASVHQDLVDYGLTVATDLEEAVEHGDFRLNLPRVEQYGAVGDRDDRIVHDHSYTTSGDLIYGSDVVSRLARAGGLREGYAFHYLSNHCGDTGHNCPVICNYETSRVLRSFDSVPGRDEMIALLETPSFTNNWTAAQFLTEVQGGSDVGANDARARQADDGSWLIRGEKWFCSNANADLHLISARYDTGQAGTRGLSLFLVPARKPDGSRNDFTFRRLKEKLGTRALASAEIDYRDAYALPLGPVETGFRNLMTMVIHHSRLAHPLAMSGMLSRAYQLARSFADHRQAFGSTIIDFPLVRDNLARIKVDLLAATASTFAVVAMQDSLDTDPDTAPERQDLCRLMANVNKTTWSTRIVARMIDAGETLAGNGMIETTSSMPRLIRDAITSEKWEGSQNTLRMQVLRDIQRFGQDHNFSRAMDRLAEDIDPGMNERATLEAAISRCRVMFEELRGAPQPIQTLLMQRILPQIADTFAYWALVSEGMDQASHGNRRKLAAAELFDRTYLSEARTVYDADHLERIAEIVRASR